jgi:hypothetical protein
VFIFVYVFISIIMTAWIVGTITLLVVKSDEKTGEYRDSLSNLEVYNVTHDIPKVRPNCAHTDFMCLGLGSSLRYDE